MLEGKTDKARTLLESLQNEPNLKEAVAKNLEMIP